MLEPTTATAGAIAAAVSTATMALLGVDYYSLIWGMVGALLALFQDATMGRVRSVVYVTLSTLVGAACGTGALSFIASTSRPLLIVFSLVSGFGALLIVSALLKVALRRIERVGGTE